MQAPDEWGKDRGLTVDTIGWCHQCFTFQRYGNRRTTPTRRGLCVNEDCDQTWAFGIWNMSEQPEFAEKSSEWGRRADDQEQAEP